MTTENIRRLHLWYGIALAVLTAVVGILFISQAADIYYGGEGYSRELVIERCTAIAAPFWIWVAAIIAGGVLWMIYPPEQKKLKRIPDAREDADRLYGMCAKSCDKEGFDQAYAAVRRERRVRGIVWIVCMALCLVCAGAGAYFAFNFGKEDPSRSKKDARPCGQGQADKARGRVCRHYRLPLHTACGKDSRARRRDSADSARRAQRRHGGRAGQGDKHLHRVHRTGLI